MKEHGRSLLRHKRVLSWKKLLRTHQQSHAAEWEKSVQWKDHKQKIFIPEQAEWKFSKQIAESR